MTWVPIVFGAFKLIVVVVAMYFGIKSHYDGAKEQKAKDEAKAKESSQIQQG